MTALTGFAGAGFLLGLFEIAVRADHLIGTPGVRAWVAHAALGLIGITGPVRFARPWAADTVSYTTGTFGLLAVLAAVVLLVRPGEPRPARSSVFARAEQLGAGPVLRLWHRLLRLFSRVWQIESLYRANAKLLPLWQPRYLCFPTARDLPRIAVAALTAEAFLPARRATDPTAALALTTS
ncbi:phosphatidylglycerol lysyltransferase domain-containing protein [Actinoplanes sp. CA-252034]|uniref:phosphatidylglycerol lysyltransferase domain-containing protein n=1 Tax=Actinoplanes sp. CA-252034 TaxID=3239906 RepID=UPI003D9652CA